MAVQVEAPAPYSRLKVALTICFHSSCAIASTLVSKTALNSFDAPILLLALQFTVQVILLTAIGVPTGWIKPFQSFSTWKSLLPLAVARLTGILAKTFCLAAVDAAFYQVARGLLLPFTLLLSLALLRPRPYFPSLSLVGAGLVMLGFVAGLSNDFGRHLTGVKGIVLGVGSSFTTAVESVVVKKYLSPSNKRTVNSDTNDNNEHQEEDLGVWQMVWMSNVLSLVFFIPLLIISGDMSTLGSFVLPTSWSMTADPLNSGDAPAAAGVARRALLLFTRADAPSSNAEFLRLSFLTGFVGFLLTIATFMQISVTSPTTHMIVTAARGVAQSGLAVLMLGEVLTTGRAGSMALIVGGSTLYGFAKDRYAHKPGGSGGSVANGGAYSQVATEDNEMVRGKLDPEIGGGGRGGGRDIDNEMEELRERNEKYPVVV